MDLFHLDILKGRRALVTGGGSGICRGIALMLARHGADVAVLSRTQESLDAAAAEIASLGRRSLGVAADVRQPEAVETAVQAVVSSLGGIDLLVNGAAGNFLSPAVALSTNAFRTVVDIDLVGTFNVSKACFPHLQACPGDACILNISATLHYGGTPMQSHVSAAKAGIDALTRNLAVEWGPFGVRVNGIAPGGIEGTEGMRRLAPGELAGKLEARVPLRRFGTIDEIGHAAIFLASRAAAYVNGHTLVVDGGRWLDNLYLEL
jgi:peroxisomal 2,4-dienoyl-CoA reductase